MTEQTIDFSIFEYSVPEQWYNGVYHDRMQCRKASRSFSLLHKRKADECWLVIHGYRGYPGEFVRPAIDLFMEGYDVFVPRLPGHGTCGKDFIRSHSKDWMGLAANAIADLKGRYSKVHLLGHSMGTAMVAILACGDPEIGKIVYVSPSFENLQMSWPARLALWVLSIFTPKVNCYWHPRWYHTPFALNLHLCASAMEILYGKRGFPVRNPSKICYSKIREPFQSRFVDFLKKI